MSADQVLGIHSLYSAHHPKAAGLVPFHTSELRSGWEHSGKGLSWDVLTLCYCNECHWWEIIVLGVYKPCTSIISGLNVLEYILEAIHFSSRQYNIDNKQ